MSRALVFVLLLIAAGFAIAGAYWLTTPRESRLAPFSDREYVARAEKSDPARAFLDQYPQATRSVDRSYGLVVQFTVERNGRRLRLSIVMDSFENRPLDQFVECDSGPPEPDIAGYLRTETCLGK